MGRKSKKQLFVEYVFKDIENDPSWEDLKSALYVERIINFTRNEPLLLHNTIKYEAETFWEYQTTFVSPDITKEELITCIGDVLDTELINKLKTSLNLNTVL